jgi:hypothetical protein
MPFQLSELGLEHLLVFTLQVPPLRSAQQFRQSANIPILLTRMANPFQSLWTQTSLPTWMEWIDFTPYRFPQYAKRWRRLDRLIS